MYLKRQKSGISGFDRKCVGKARNHDHFWNRRVKTVSKDRLRTILKKLPQVKIQLYLIQDFQLRKSQLEKNDQILFFLSIYFENHVFQRFL